MREAGVQTQMDGLSYTWTSGFAALGPSVGMSQRGPRLQSQAMLSALRLWKPLRHTVCNCGSKQASSLFTCSSPLGPANYSYTTLEDTKEFIRSHKSPQLDSGGGPGGSASGDEGVSLHLTWSRSH
ncbi:hypothetical protein SKAU_G00052250 [Synaphobranchus kaupii]|uniref:DUF4614 domain-containing protein n=1 Tax=Synaphobranchus kaupii TaxID=118154 RepID=A0A9Q1G4N1_SYNKA|nr:hypothetical protein SKAU_G00052250 [Synaphobranchus kaupii]